MEKRRRRLPPIGQEQEQDSGRISAKALRGWLVSVLLSLLCIQLFIDIPLHNYRHAAAANGDRGEAGTFTATREERIRGSNGRTKRICYGDFRPADGGTGLSGIRGHVPRGGCEEGRTHEARLMRADSGGLLRDAEPDQAYAGGGLDERGFTVLLMGAFLLLFGGIATLVALVKTTELLSAVLRRGKKTSESRGKSRK
ncbi:hypothetical protein U9R90_32560 [Streptomyces sp. E11-3]|uniref:hypothetical protein n=1 Tax=Streptomyces sp. E11-3 TaxID=3110112 RepID=UPI00397FA0C9